MKKAGLDNNDLKNYRPVSNLPFISKLLEKVVLKQLLNLLSAGDLIEPNQSAYRKGHGTETAVLSVMDGLLSSTDERLVSLVALLDLSAAFDTIDHSVLLRRLELTFGVREVVLQWFTSYLSDRYQSVSVGDTLSRPSPLLYGVPQGSVLGPALFLLYSQPLSSTILRHNCSFQKFADDTELSQSGPPSDFDSVKQSIQSCVQDLHSWTDSNKLKMNADKTDVMTVGTTTCLKQVHTQSVVIIDSDIPFKPSLKYLGVKIDQTLSMHDHIGEICKICFLYIRRIASIRSYLSESATVRLVTAFVLSRLDYCNSVLAGLPADQLTVFNLSRTLLHVLSSRKRSMTISLPC